MKKRKEKRKEKIKSLEPKTNDLDKKTVKKDEENDIQYMIPDHNNNLDDEINDKVRFKNTINLFQEDESNYNVLFEKQDDEDDAIESLFSNTGFKKKKKEKIDINIENLDNNDINNINDVSIDKHTYFPINTKKNKIANDNISDNSIDKSQQKTENSVDMHQMDKPKLSTDGFSSEINKTKNMDQFINENPELKKQYDNLNKYYDFTLKSLKFIVPKFNKNKEDNISGNENNDNTNNFDELESKYIHNTTLKINNLISETINTNSLNQNENDDEKFYSIEENYNPILNAPMTEEQRDRLNKFKNFLVKDVKNSSTQDLLQNIANVIQDSYTEEIQKRNEEQSKLKEIEIVDEIKIKENNNNIQQTVNLEVKMDNNNQDKNKYQFYYRGILCSSDKPMNKKENSDNSKDSDIDE